MYTDQGRVESYLKRELTDEEIDIIDEVILQNSSYINGYTNREWLSVDTEVDDEIDDLEPSERIFNGNGKRELFIDDFTLLESISVQDNQGNEVIKYEEETDWLLYPLNKNPKQSIHLRTGSFQYGQGNIEVTAVWGAGIVPADIVVVCTALVAKYLQKATSSTGMYSSESIEGYSYKLLNASEIDSDTANVLKNLDKWKKFIL
jgi:hypothetical protein